VSFNMFLWTVYFSNNLIITSRGFISGSMSLNFI
jgi:hypothetical protein